MSKKEVSENQENNKSAEIEALFKEAEKIPYGEILASTFQYFTEADGWEMNGHKLIGRVGDKGDSPWMVLANLRVAKEIRLEVFSERKNIRFPGDLTFIAGRIFKEPITDTLVDGIAYNFKSDTRILSNRYNRFLIKIVGEVSLKYLESRKGSKSKAK